jgi:hypothetical protein
MWTTVPPVSQNWETPAKTVTAVSITEAVADCRDVVPIGGTTGYGVRVPRTDENGKQLKALLDYLLDGEVDAKDVYDALGISSSTYYRRIKESDYPAAEELRKVADRFDLSYPDLQVRFGLMSRQELWHYVESVAGSDRFSVATVAEPTVEQKVTRRRRLADLSPRQDAPPL